MDRFCEWCGLRVYAKRRDARFCGAHCRVASARAAKKLPAEMTSRDRWMRYRLVARGAAGKATKVPTRLNGRNASSTGPSSWTSFAEAKRSDVGAGLGFALGDGIGCIDLDDCLDDGVVAGWAQRILDACPATFVEVSQSGKGLHVFGLLPEAHGRNLRSKGSTVEVYSAGRFIAVTGVPFRGSVPRLADLSDVLSVL